MKFNISKDRLLEGMHIMNSFGIRLTGSKGHNDFIKWIKEEIADMDIPVYSDPFYFRRWEEKKSSIEIIDGDEKINIPVSSAYPYSGETSAQGITEELVYVSGVKDIPKTTGKIAVFNVANINFLPSEIAFDKRTSYPEDVVLEKKYEGPVITSFVQCFYGILSKLSKAKAVILIWKGLHDDMIEGQYLSFVADYQNMPMLWVNETNGKRIIEAAKKQKKQNSYSKQKSKNTPLLKAFTALLKVKIKRKMLSSTHIPTVPTV